jgi:hypothetical protein
VVLGNVISVDSAPVVGLDDFQPILEVLLERDAAVVHVIEHAKFHYSSRKPCAADVSPPRRSRLSAAQG